jgi:hypothetical protein
MRKFVLMIALSVLPTTAAHALPPSPPVAVPEPSNYVLMVSGLAALAVVARRRRRA